MVETAIVLPVLYLLLIGTIELSSALNAYRAVSEGQQNLERMLARTADLTSSSGHPSESGETDMYDYGVGETPTSHSNAQIEVMKTLIWSGAPITNIKIKSGYDPVKRRIVSEVEADYRSIFARFLNGIKLKAAGRAPYLS